MQRTRNRTWAAALLVIVGCDRPKAPHTTQPSQSPSTSAPAHAPSAVESTQISDADKIFNIVFRPDPFPIEASRSFSLHVAVARRTSGEPIGEHTSLIVDAAMPEHRHGMNTQPRVRGTGPGKFVAEGMLLHMPGRWEIYFDVVEGAVTRRATHVIELE